jgi:hypothetical protein
VWFIVYLSRQLHVSKNLNKGIELNYCVSPECGLILLNLVRFLHTITVIGAGLCLLTGTNFVAENITHIKEEVTQFVVRFDIDSSLCTQLIC